MCYCLYNIIIYKYGGETVDSRTVLAILGYILAVFFPIVGLIYGLVLYFVKGDDEYIKKHAKYMIIIAVIMLIIDIIIVATFGLTFYFFGTSA